MFSASIFYCAALSALLVSGQRNSGPASSNSSSPSFANSASSSSSNSGSSGPSNLPSLGSQVQVDSKVSASQLEANVASVNRQVSGASFSRPSNCPRLGPVPDSQRFGCGWIVGINQFRCQQYQFRCGNEFPNCRSNNQIWYRCPSVCEPSCSNPNAVCWTTCNSRGQCQCAPGFVRSRRGDCVRIDSCNNGCSSSQNCPANHFCLNGRCEQFCTSSRDCSRNEFCRANVCIDSQSPPHSFN